jgi:NAD+ synthase (glutamine-hydrolysing)
MAGGFAPMLKDVHEDAGLRAGPLSQQHRQCGDSRSASSNARRQRGAGGLTSRTSDSLPPYNVLDRILERYVERDMSANAIIDEGFDAETVRRVVRMVDLNEYKRRQAPIGPRITRKAFGRDRRYPVTSGWLAGD